MNSLCNHLFDFICFTCKPSTAKLTDCITQNGYQLDAIVNINLPEQGISGPFRITSIEHILPQKQPVDEDAGKGFVFRPVTGIFIPTTK